MYQNRQGVGLYSAENIVICSNGNKISTSDNIVRRITKETDWTGFAACILLHNSRKFDWHTRADPGPAHRARPPVWNIFFCKFWLENTYTIFKNFSQHTMCTICILFSVLTTRTFWGASKQSPDLKNNSYRAGTAPWFWNSCIRQWYIREIMLLLKKIWSI